MEGNLRGISGASQLRAFLFGGVSDLNASNDFQKIELGSGHVQSHFLKLAMLNPTTMFNYAIFVVGIPPCTVRYTHLNSNHIIMPVPPE